jgi:RNA polymerase primary sigma factor
MINRPNNPGDQKRGSSLVKGRSPRAPFIFGAKASGKASQPRKNKGIAVKGDGAEAGAAKDDQVNASSSGQFERFNITEVIKTLIEMAREQGHLTYDDINDVLPDGVSPDDLDTLYTKLQGVGIEGDKSCGG